MRRFTHFLRSQNLKATTIEAYKRRVHHFIQWCESHSLQLSKVKYHHIMEYIDHQKSKGLTVRTINQDQVALRYYFDSINPKRNPCAGVIIKGTPRSIPKDLLDDEQLRELYTNHPMEKETQYRDKIIIGLLVFQGLSTGDVELLQPNHVELEKGQITIPKRTTTNERVLTLHPQQILHLHHYINVIRPLLNNQRENHSELLLFSTSTATIRSVVQRLAKKLKRQHSFFNNYQQIRASVIANWMKQYNLREVQYMAGHRYVSSTEKFRRADVTELQMELGRFDPLLGRV